MLNARLGLRRGLLCHRVRLCRDHATCSSRVLDCRWIVEERFFLQGNQRHRNDEEDAFVIQAAPEAS